MFKKFLGFWLVAFCMLALSGVAEAHGSLLTGYGPPGLDHVAGFVGNVDSMVFSLDLGTEPAEHNMNSISVKTSSGLPIVHGKLHESIGSVLVSFHRARSYLPDIL